MSNTSGGGSDIFPPVPWPEGEREPRDVRHLPGGVVTAGTVLIILLGVIVQLVKLVARCFRRPVKRSFEEALKQQGDDATKLAGCVGPKLVIVLRVEEECKFPSQCCTPLMHPRSLIREELNSWLLKPEHLVAKPVDFAKDSPLAGREVWVVGIREEALQERAEAYKMLKLVDGRAIEEQFNRYIARGKRCSTLDDEGSGSFAAVLARRERQSLSERLHDRSRKFNCWLPFKRDQPPGFFLRPPQDALFGPSEVMEVMLGILGHASSPEGYPVFLAAQEVGEIDAIFPVVDRPEDRAEYDRVLHGWKSCCFWRKPPVEELARLFGPSVALYFAYMQQYAVWLCWPALVAMGSLAWHLQHPREGTTGNDWAARVQWGASFEGGWSQAGMALVLSGWSTAFFMAWRRHITSETYRLGQDKQRKDSHGLDGAHVYFKARGFKLSRRKGVYKSIVPFRMPNVWRHVFVTVALFLFMFLSGLIIAGLCWVSDKASLISYFENEDVNVLCQNLLSVACYLVISTPLQSVYEKLTRFITEMEQHRDRSKYVERLVRRRAFFQLVNYLGWFCYLGFGKEDMVALRSQLTVFFIFKPAGLLGTCVELICAFCCGPRPKDKGTLQELIETEYDKPEPSLFEEYLEITILFAAAACFAPVFPEGLFIATLHTVFEYFGDKNKLYTRLRVGLPLKSDFYAITAWITVWQGIGWLSIVISTWLVYVFIRHSGVSLTREWEPVMHLPFGLDPVQTVLGDMEPGRKHIFLVFFLEHFILLFKAYLIVTVNTEPQDMAAHRELLDKIFDDRRDRDRS